MKNNIKQKISAYLLFVSLLLSSCGEKAQCEIPVKHVHKYTKHVTDGIDIEKYLLDEHLISDGYNWQEDYIEITDIDQKIYKLLGKMGLFRGDKNWEYLFNKMSSQHDFLKFYYEYYTTETYTTTDSEGKTHVRTRTVHHDGWTDDPYHSDTTGKTRLYHHKYYGFRVLKNGDKYSLEESPLVDDIRDVIDEYPYFGEGCSTTVYEQFNFNRYELPLLSPDNFDVFTQPDLSNSSIDKNNKILTKNITN